MSKTFRVTRERTTFESASYIADSKEDVDVLLKYAAGFHFSWQPEMSKTKYKYTVEEVEPVDEPT